MELINRICSHFILSSGTVSNSSVPVFDNKTVEKFQSWSRSRVLLSSKYSFPMGSVPTIYLFVFNSASHSQKIFMTVSPRPSPEYRKLG